MKKFLTALSIGLMMSSTTFAAGDITLPTVGIKSKEISVTQALQQRKSSRNFIEKDLTSAQMAKILWAANGINRPDGKRVNPAGKGVYCVEVYAVTREGIYLYDADKHTLKLVAAGDYRLIAANGKEAPAKAAVNLVYVETPAVWSSLEKIPERDRQAFYADIMVGAMIQSVALAAESEGLGGYVRGGVKRDEFKKVANLSDDKRIILAQSIGFTK